jgi:hypothetical protein
MRSVLTRTGAIVLGFLLAGAAGGVLWERLWEPPVGVTYEDQWFLEPAGPDFSFSGIALFVLIAFPLGLVLAVLSGMWSDHELSTVATVLVAAALAGVVMYAVGAALGPADPQVLAAGSPDYTPLPSDLGLTAPDRGRTPWHSTAFVALPAGAMTGLVGMYLFGSRGFARRPRG